MATSYRRSAAESQTARLERRKTGEQRANPSRWLSIPIRRFTHAVALRLRGFIPPVDLGLASEAIAYRRVATERRASSSWGDCAKDLQMGGPASPRARARRINNMTSDFVCFVYFVVHQQPHSIRGDLCSSVVKKTSIAIEDCGSDGTSPSQKSG